MSLNYRVTHRDHYADHRNSNVTTLKMSVYHIDIASAKPPAGPYWTQSGTPIRRTTGAGRRKLVRAMTSFTRYIGGYNTRSPDYGLPL